MLNRKREGKWIKLREGDGGGWEEKRNRMGEVGGTREGGGSDDRGGDGMREEASGMKGRGGKWMG